MSGLHSLLPAEAQLPVPLARQLRPQARPCGRIDPHHSCQEVLVSHCEAALPQQCVAAAAAVHAHTRPMVMPAGRVTTRAAAVGTRAAAVPQATIREQALERREVVRLQMVRLAATG